MHRLPLLWTSGAGVGQPHHLYLEIMSKYQKATLKHARDEMYRQIHACDVLKATPEHQEQWLRDSMGYFEEMFPGLSDRELNELRVLGERFCQPPIPHGKAYSELTRDEWQDEVVQEASATA